MKHIETIREMQELAKEWKRSGIRVALVPTMGALHAGHLSLIKRARQAVSSSGKVVVSVYVNPIQFAPNEDFSKYPRDLQNDLRLCEETGADVVFSPSDQVMYPYKSEENAPALRESTYVCEGFLSQSMEGITRPTHFRGVTTVVNKLFNITLPDYAVFGAKDFQQAAIIKRMVRDLNIPVEIITAPIVREADGLALSSRNRYLSPDERTQALCLSQAITLARQKVSQVAQDAQSLKADLKAFIEKNPSAQVDYIEFFDPETLAPSAEAKQGIQTALAVRVGKTRLIDNATL